MCVGMELLRDAASPEAFHNSSERFDDSKCYPDTRVAVLTKIMDWIIGRIACAAYIMWLFGPAGAGKSAIAQTIAEMCHDRGILLVSFFFSRSDPKQNNVKPLAPSLAYQIAVNIPQVKSMIEGIVAHNPAIFQSSFKVQFNTLIMEPLIRVFETQIIFYTRMPYLVIIDGLDECTDVNIQRHILDTIANALSRFRHRVPVMFLVSSRAERDISLTFSTPAFQGITSRIALDDTYQPAADIRRHLEGGVAEIKKTHLHQASIPLTWPAGEDLKSLVDKSSGQFIYAATIIRYIRHSDHNPTDNLKIILGLHPRSSPTTNGEGKVTADMPFAELDALYKGILSRVKDIQVTLRLLGVLLLSAFPYSTPEDIAGLMFLDCGDVFRLLVDLPSVVMVRDSDYDIKFLHASFGDFLLDQERSEQYHIDPGLMFTELSFFGLRHLDQYPGEYVLVLLHRNMHLYFNIFSN